MKNYFFFQVIPHFSKIIKNKALNLDDEDLDRSKYNPQSNNTSISTIAYPKTVAEHLSILPAIKHNNFFDETLKSTEDSDSLNHILEISAAVRSLKTNLCLSLILLVIFICLAIFSDTVNVVMATSTRGFVPIVTTLANFVKVQNVFLIYWTNIWDKFLVIAKLVMCKNPPSS